MEEVVQAVAQLSRFDEAQLAKYVARGRLKELFGFRPRDAQVPADFVVDNEVAEASATPFDDAGYARLLQSSMPTAENSK